MKSVCLGVLGWALLGLNALAAPDAPIPLDQLGAVAAQQYHGDGLGVSVTPEGAQLRCVFQRLTGRVTPEGLWLESTEPGGGQLHLRATAIGRETSSARSDIFVARSQRDQPAPSGAAYSDEVFGVGAMSLLPELGDNVWGLACYNDVAPDGAVGPLLPENQTLPCTGNVSVQDGRVQFIRPGLVEEYSVSMDGVRQDFIVEGETSNPECRVGELRVELELTGARAETLPNGVRLTLDGSGRELTYSRLRVTDATGKELPARFDVAATRQSAAELEREDGGGLPTRRYARLAVLVEDAEAVYPVRIDPTFSDADWVSLNPTGIPGANSTVRAIAVDANGHVYIGGEFTFAGTVAASRVAKWDGSTWSALGEGADGEVRALAVIGTDLYAGGSFTNAGSVAAMGIAKWNGTSWSALGSGINGYVNSLAVSGTTLYACGTFSMPGQTTAPRIARWNGSTWTSLGWVSRSTDPFAWSLAASGDNLYLGGGFTSVSWVADGSTYSVTANSIAKWNGSMWSALGSGISYPPGYGHVRALAAMGSDLYAGGNFTRAGGVAATNIARWNGSSWSALGSGVVTYGTAVEVWALTVIDNTLYAGGAFTIIGGLPANYIAKWNGSSWSALGSGMDSWVRALAVSGTNLYAGGSFTTAGGLGVNRISKWDGNTWSALGSGMNSHVYALGISGSDLYLGGGFISAPGITANRMAKWNGSSWSALGSGMDSRVRALALDDAGHLFVGGQFLYAGDKVSPFIAQANLTPQPMAIEGIRVEAGVATLDCRGAAGGACAVQRATDVRFTQDLTTLHTTNAPPDGRFTCTDATPPATTAFYRLVRP